MLLFMSGLASVAAAPLELGPLPYLQASDSPFANTNFDYFYLEDFEDGSFNTPGVSYSPAWQVGALSTFQTDSVDGDDGVIDGLGRDGKDIWSILSYEKLTVNFDQVLLGALPTHVGIVWTDAGRNGGGPPRTFPFPVTFEFTDANGARLDSATIHQVGDGLATGQTDEDRFFGAIHDAGILSMTLRMPGYTNWSLDHIQYGFQSASTCNGKPVTVFIGNGDTPTSGPDVILGTTGADTIVAMGGDDTICGLGGDDDINGGRGEDWIDAGSGNDTVQGANDADEIYGDSGVDTLFGGPGNDIIYGEQGDDNIKGNSGNDTLEGGDGIDKISGGSGNDTIETGSGSNVGTGQTVTGGDGDDNIYGGPDADEIRGESGDDTIRGRGENDKLYGGGGEDDINGEDGDDLVRGNAADDLLKGGDGDDQIDGLGGNDLMYGGAGADTMSGSTGNDIMYGQTGDDSLSGGGGDDDLNGGGGTDDCNGAGGNGDTAASCETQINIP